MKIKKKDRSWKVGEKKTINITEKIKIELDDNEQASFVEKNGNYSYEVCKKIGAIIYHLQLIKE